MPLQHRFIPSIFEISCKQWNQLNENNNPFLRHEFLGALEKHHCVGEQYGWLPRHLIITENDILVAVMPCYIKLNSYGEFVFDWSWANFYQQHNEAYYPKLVVAAPYSPVTGERLLLSKNNADRSDIFSYASECLRDFATHNELSSVHVLFPPSAQAEHFAQNDFELRNDCQFHWNNNNYESFDDYLLSFSSKKRRNIKQERNKIKALDLTFQHLTGPELTTDDWTVIHQLYQSTFARLSGHPTLSQSFFEEISQTMGDSVLVICVRDVEQNIVAAAICLKNNHTLYGRHWGCSVSYKNLHFETCYYQGLSYCIDNKLQHFEPGAQGEHKLSRGFVPVITQSAHWIKNPRFRQVISDFLHREKPAIQDYAETLEQHLPFKKP